MSGKENSRRLWTAQLAQHPGSVSKPRASKALGLTTRNAATPLSTSKQGGLADRATRCPGLSERNVNSGTRTSAKRGRDEHESDGSEPASRLQGPLRVRVDNTRPEISLSFWSLPSSATTADPGDDTSKASRGKHQNQHQRHGRTAAATSGLPGSSRPPSPGTRGNHREQHGSLGTKWSAQGASTLTNTTATAAAAGAPPPAAAVHSNSKAVVKAIHERNSGTPTASARKRPRADSVAAHDTAAAPHPQPHAVTTRGAASGLMARAGPSPAIANANASAKPNARVASAAATAIATPSESPRADAARNASANANARHDATAAVVADTPVIPARRPAAAAAAVPAGAEDAASLSHHAAAASPFRTDYSHILSWKPAARPGGATSSASDPPPHHQTAATTARLGDSSSGNNASVEAVVGVSLPGAVVQPRAAAPGTSSRRQDTTRAGSANLAVGRSSSNPGSHTVGGDGRTGAAGSSGVGGVVGGGEDGRISNSANGDRAAGSKGGGGRGSGGGASSAVAASSAPQATKAAGVAPVPPRVSLDALRVRVSARTAGSLEPEEDDDDDDDDDSFEINMKLKEYPTRPPPPGASTRPRSVDGKPRAGPRLATRSATIAATPSAATKSSSSAVAGAGVGGRISRGVNPGASASGAVVAATGAAEAVTDAAGLVPVRRTNAPLPGAGVGVGSVAPASAATTKPDTAATLPQHHQKQVVDGDTTSEKSRNEGESSPVMERVAEEGAGDTSLTIAAGSRGAGHRSGGARTPPFGSRQPGASDQTGGGKAVATGLGSGLLGCSGGGGGAGSGANGVGKHREVAFAQVATAIGSEVMVGGTRYWKTAKIGRGGSSEVFRVVAPDGRMLALKVVKVDEQGERAQALLDSYSNEIDLLKRLTGNRFIIDLENAEVDRVRGVISIVLELGETDLDRLLQQHKAHSASASGVASGTSGETDLFPGGLESNFVRVIWQQMLKAVHAMHEQRVVHGDLKPANFVLVRGSLKLIDFGIAKAISNDTTNISRDSRLGTINYMCPEAFEDTGNGAVNPATGRQTPVIKLGRAGDIWSLGCILFQMTHGKTPFSHLGMLQKLHAITNRDHAIHIADLKDASLVETLRLCLQRDPSARAPIAGSGGLLSHAYLHPVATRASLEKKIEGQVNERAASVERELTRRYEARVAEELEKRLSLAVAKAVAAEQGKQSAGLSVAKSAVKLIVGETVRALGAEQGLVERGGLDRLTAIVMGGERSRGGNHAMPPPPPSSSSNSSRQ